MLVNPLPLEDANLLPNARAFLAYSERLNQLGDYSKLEPALLRGMLAQMEKPSFDLPTLHNIVNRTIPVKGADIAIRIYQPLGDGPFPVVVYYHGGGWVLGDLETTNEACHILASRGIVVVSVDYRLAPEHPFPTPFNDSYDALMWVAEHLDTLQGDPTKLYVAGDSAGGNISAALALCAKVQGPELAGQILVYPATSLDYNNDSYTLFGESYGLNKDLVVWFYDHYTKKTNTAKHPYAAPLYAENVNGVPRALIFTAENDVLRDEIQHYVDKLSKAGINVTHHFMQGLVHGYFSNYALFEDNIHDTVDRIVAFIKEE